MKIGIFYSYGPQFITAYPFISERYPNAEIFLFIPQNFPEDYFENDKINLVKLPWDGKHQPAHKALITLLKVLETIRTYNLDILVILFETPRLITMSKLSKSRNIYVYDIYKNFYPVQHNLISIWLYEIGRRIKGLITYLYIWCHIYLFK